TITEEDSESLLQVDVNNNEQSQVVKEAMLALEALGYSKRELSKVEKVLNKQSVSSVDEAVKLGLQTLVS
ncbi:RuvA C-terminal domain-containing protein, partial [Staphylococcus aureus]